MASRPSFPLLDLMPAGRQNCRLKARFYREPIPTLIVSLFSHYKILFIASLSKHILFTVIFILSQKRMFWSGRMGLLYRAVRPPCFIKRRRLCTVG